MELLKFLAWLVMNVGVPLLAPIALLPLMGISKRYRNHVGKLIRRSLQEGQLLWAVIAMCAAACYEAAGHAALSETDEIGEAITWATIGWHVVVIIASSVLVLFATIDVTDEAAHREFQKVSEADEEAPLIMLVSIFMAFVTAVTFSVTHLWAVSLDA